MGVPNDSPLRNPNQVPFSDPPRTVQNPSRAANEEEIPSIRELVQAIDSYVELVDLEVTSNLHAITQSAEDVQTQPPPAAQPAEDAPEQPTKDTTQLLPTDPAI